MKGANNYPLSGVVMFTHVCIVQITRKGLTFGPCPRQWGANYYIILRIFLIDGLYSVIWHLDIMQLLSISNDVDLSHISQE